MMPRILVVGSANIDFVCRVEKIPEPGETVVSDGTYAFVPGGKGANTAVAARRLGADVVFCARLGSDSYGKQLTEKYAAEGIDTRFLVKDKTARTGLASVMVDGTGQNRICVFPGANAKLCMTDVENAFTTYPDMLLLQLEVDRELVINATRLAAEQGVKTVLDAGPATSDFPLEKLGRLEIISPNETETRVLTGITPNSSENCLRACVNLMNRVDTKYVVLKLGERGCFVYDGVHCNHVAPVEVGPAVDTTAAGDAFTASLGAEYLKNGGDILKAAEISNAVGAYVVKRPGAFSSLPRKKELEEFLASR